MPNQTSLKLNELDNFEEDVHNSNSNRTKTIVESFTITKGTGVVHLIFESFPMWLLVITPFMFKHACFSCLSGSELKQRDQ